MVPGKPYTRNSDSKRRRLKMAYLRRRNAKQWARFAMKVGLFLTDAKLLSAINHQLRERAENFTDSMRDSYEETTDRLDDARIALRGHSHWLGSTLGFLGGVGIGVGLGMLLAPVSGEEARSVIRDKASDVRHKVSDFATKSSGSTQYRSTPTGTTGD
jgi:YtxH-like protein